MKHAVNTATLTGLVAILLWSTSVGMIRSVTELLGTTAGAALIYSVSALCVAVVKGFPRLGKFNRIYLLLGGALFVSYEICLALALGIAHSRPQALEIGMINYLWPCLTILFSLFMNQQKSTWWIWPGFALSFTGIVWVMKGDGHWSPALMWQNICENPVAYGLAFLAAILWALYCNLARRYGGGKSAVSLFLLGTAVLLWIKYALGSHEPINFTLPAVGQLLFIGAATATAYSCWDSAIQKGNMTLLATVSYFTPIFSTLLASLWLQITPGFAFWQGVAMVTLGSLVCWRATRER